MPNFIGLRDLGKHEDKAGFLISDLMKNQIRFLNIILF